MRSHRNRNRITGRRVAAATLAVTTVTIVTTVTGTLVVTPAFAARATGILAAGTGTREQAVVDMPADTNVLGSGPSGFLWAHRDTYHWTRYADGAVTTLPRGSGAEPAFYTGGVRSDIVVGHARGAGHVYTLYDMGTQDAAPVVIDASHLGSGTHFSRLVGSIIVLSTPHPNGTAVIHLLSNKNGRTIHRTVQGVPAAMRWADVDVSPPDTLILRYQPTADERVWRAALVDIGSASVVEDRALAGTGPYSHLLATDASATHFAWTEGPSDGGAVLRVARRGQEDSERIPLGQGTRLTVGFLRDWVAYGLSDARYATAPNPLHALTARSLKNGRTIKLLDLVRDIRNDGEGAILVEGGTVEQGEGLYRITAGPEGDPIVTLVARTGRSVVLNLTGQSVPTGVDFSKTPHPRLSWQFTPSVNALVQVVLTHKASGRTTTLATDHLSPDGRADLTWSGLFDGGGSVQHGSYTWRMTARTGYGLGPTHERSGTLTVNGPHLPHNFSNSIGPDLLVKSGSGRLAAYDTRDILAWDPDDQVPPAQAKWSTTGWGGYDRLVTPGDIGGAPHADVLARDRSGVLWQHLGTGDLKKPFAPRTRIGGGWQTYRLITGGSDLTGDGRPDLVAVDKAGDQWLYKATGSWSKPFAARVRLGRGWNIYDLVTATGNLAGAPAGDLLARDKDGVLWLHLGRGDGTFAPRTRIGAGWNHYSEITAVGDLDRDGRPDLMARSRTDDPYKLRVHHGTGRWATPLAEFGPRPWDTQFLSEDSAQY
ncbi:FG-GAP repeat domain-containing protein [Streptomyces sp. NPDC056480]|uniref:FG-GAP repeat domain-containing protein n=1 Tax=Streptomyces sp. NPDC056480 TaxID=3345833 RepID=UPI0036C32499